MSALVPLIRLMVENGRSQSQIADLLNRKQLHREDGKPWHQAAVSQYMQANHIEPAFLFNRWNSRHSGECGPAKQNGYSDEQQEQSPV